LFVSAEDDEDELHRRLHEMSVGMDFDMASLNDLTLWSLADQDAVLATEGKDGQLVATPRWNELLAHAEEARPALIVLDSLADIYGGNENIRAQVRQFVGMLRRLAISTNSAVVVLSHPSLAGLSSGSGASGSTAWSNSVRSRIYFTKPESSPGLDADPDLRILSLKKANYSAAQPDLRIRRRIGGYMLDDASVGTDVAGARDQVDALFLELVDAYAAEGRRVSDATSAAYAPTLFARDPRANGITKAGFTSAMGRLFAAGKIKVETLGPPSKSRRQLVTVRGE
jgi:RecA-family ATPase